jgi:hypothetical protein
MVAVTLMTLSELETAVWQALETGQIGVPLSLKVWLHRPEGDLEVAENLAHLIERFVPMLRDVPSMLLATGADDGGYLQILLTGRVGRTALFIGSTAHKGGPHVRLLLVGNHGILELSGDSPWTEERAVASPHADAWVAAIESSRRANECVNVQELLPGE